MSHFTKLDRAQITSPEAFKKAAKELGFTEIKENAEMRGFMGNRQKADVVASRPGCAYDVGIVKAGSKYDLISDWWGVRQTIDNPEDAFVRLTTKHTIVDTYRRQGFMAQVKTDIHNNITVTLTR